MTISRVEAFGRPYDYWYDRYQTYYREALRAHCTATGAAFAVVPTTRLPRILAPMRRVRDRYLARLPGRWATAGADGLAHLLEGPLHMPSSHFHNAVGQYRFRTEDGATVNVCIDSADYPELRSPELVEWSDLYLKANRWPSETYPPNVRPVVNGDPMILPRISELRAQRSAEKEIDVCFVVRVWGGRREVEGIEHNLRLLEAVNRADCSKLLLAYLVAGDIPEISARLRRSGIPTTTRPVPPRTLWRLMAKSRLNVIRLGMHDCIPWRMAGSLAIGAAVVLDQPPRAEWPEPLREGVNYLSLGCVPDHGSVDDRYDSIPALILEWLADRPRLEAVTRSNEQYFDDHVAPERVGASIFTAVESTIADRVA